MGLATLADLFRQPLTTVVKRPYVYAEIPTSALIDQSEVAPVVLNALGLSILEGFHFKRFLTGGRAALTALYEDDRARRRVYKFLICPNEKQLRHFEREAECIEHLSKNAYANYHAVLAVPLSSIADLDVHYFATEYIEGVPLGMEIVSNPPPWPEKRATEYLFRIAYAIAPTGAAWLVHRDLHSGNVLICPSLLRSQYDRRDYDPGVRIIDYGTATAWHLVALEEGNYTDNFRHPGGISTWSPESLRSPKSVNPQHDIWALGCMFYLLLSGSHAFQSNSFGEYYERVTAGNFDSIGILARQILSPLVLHILKRVFNPDPFQRIRIGALARLCDHFLTGGFSSLLDKHSHLLAEFYDCDGDLNGCPRCRTITTWIGVMCKNCGYRDEEVFALDEALALGWSCMNCS